METPSPCAATAMGQVCLVVTKPPVVSVLVYPEVMR